MSKVYTLGVTQGSEHVASAWGDLDAMAYHVRRLDLAEGVEYDATLTEHDSIFGDEIRKVAGIAADGEVVEMVLRKKLRQERATETVEAVAAAE